MSDSCRPVQVLYFSFPQFLYQPLSDQILAPTLQFACGQQHLEFKMAAAAGKFVWLETLRKATKTSLVQDGK